MIIDDWNLVICHCMYIVICFHSLNYWYLQQHYRLQVYTYICCDLLSFFELLIFTTTTKNTTTSREWLWFAFILWTTDIYNNEEKDYREEVIVVICFHSLNYWYLQQHMEVLTSNKPGCDLLSFFELLIFTTTSRWIGLHRGKLWFAFILWTTDYLQQLIGFYSFYERSCDLLSFFELLIFTTTAIFKEKKRTSCDLLSFFELLIFTTTDKANNLELTALWFAFILWTTDIYNNSGFLYNIHPAVVICFHSLNYWYLQQLVVLHLLMVLSCDLLSFFELLIFTTTMSVHVFVY